MHPVAASVRRMEYEMPHRRCIKTSCIYCRISSCSISAGSFTPGLLHIFLDSLSGNPAIIHPFAICTVDC